VSVEASDSMSPLADALAAVDSAFGDCSRPEKFTDHPYCDECAEADTYFRSFTPVTLAEVTEPPETLPIPFLTDEAFAYRAGFTTLVARTGSGIASGMCSSTSRTASAPSIQASAGNPGSALCCL
jgi:hypothetical protein